MSNVDPNVPTSPIAYTADIRRNFQIIKQELEEIQAYVAANQNNDSPTFTGTIHAQNMEASGDVTVNGSVIPSAGILSTLLSSGSTVVVTPQVALVPWLGNVYKLCDSIWWVIGSFTNGTGAPLGTTTVGKFPGTLASLGFTQSGFGYYTTTGAVRTIFTQSGTDVNLNTGVFMAAGEQAFINCLIKMV